MFLRKRAPIEEIDYPFLSSLFKKYKYPRNKINSLLKKGLIIRVKKGLYVFGEELSLMPYSRETLANLIYGPSCISLEYALSFYGLIPERVELVTSVTPIRSKFFNTPVGDFSYRYLKREKYFHGMTIQNLDEYHGILIATKEKAMIDKLYFYEQLDSIEDLKTYLYDDLRLSKPDIKLLDKTLMQKIGFHYKNHNVDLFVRYVLEEI